MIAAGYKAPLPGFGEDPIPHQSPAIVGNLDIDKSALVVCFQPQPGGGIFCSGYTGIGRFGAVVNRVPDHVHEGIGQFFDHVSVEFRFFAAKLEMDLLAGLSCEVADEARHALKQLADRMHPHSHGNALHVTGNAG